MNKPVKDTFGNYVRNLTQWDKNVTLYIQDTDFDVAPIFHICNSNSVESYAVESVLDNDILSIHVPNKLLEEAFPISFYLFMTSGDEGKTVEYMRLPVREKPRPIDYTEGDDTIDDFNAMKAALCWQLV